MRRVLIPILVAAALVAALPATGQAEAKYVILTVRLTSHVEPLTFDVAIDDEVDCTGDFQVTSAKIDGKEVTPVSVTPDPADPNHGTLVLPSDTTPGTLSVMAQCAVHGGGTIPALGERDFAAIAVTKAVTGPVPSGTTFTVHVACDRATTDNADPAAIVSGPFAVDLQYGASGGVHYVYLDTKATCAITEPVTGGALTSTIAPPTVDVVDTDSYPVTVTNTFAAAVEVEPTFTG